MLLKFGLVLFEVGAIYFRWCALCSWEEELIFNLLCLWGASQRETTQVPFGSFQWSISSDACLVGCVITWPSSSHVRPDVFPSSHLYTPLHEAKVTPLNLWRIDEGWAYGSLVSRSPAQRTVPTGSPDFGPQMCATEWGTHFYPW